MKPTWIRIRPHLIHPDSNPDNVCRLFQGVATDEAHPYHEALTAMVFGLRNNDPAKVITEAMSVTPPGQPATWSICVTTPNGIFGQRKEDLEDLFNDIAEEHVRQHAG